MGHSKSFIGHAQLHPRRPFGIRHWSHDQHGEPPGNRQFIRFPNCEEYFIGRGEFEQDMSPIHKCVLNLMVSDSRRWSQKECRELANCFWELSGLPSLPSTCETGSITEDVTTSSGQAYTDQRMKIVTTRDTSLPKPICSPTSPRGT